MEAVHQKSRPLHETGQTNQRIAKDNVFFRKQWSFGRFFSCPQHPQQKQQEQKNKTKTKFPQNKTKKMQINKKKPTKNSSSKYWRQILLITSFLENTPEHPIIKSLLWLHVSKRRLSPAPARQEYDQREAACYEGNHICHCCPASPTTVSVLPGCFAVTKAQTLG